MSLIHGRFTVAFLKPDITFFPNTTKYVLKIIENDFNIHRKIDSYIFDRKSAENFYSEHSKSFFFERLVTFITSGPIIPMILFSENAVERFRELLGPTRLVDAQKFPQTLRGRFGTSDVCNVAHGSEACNVIKEALFFFPDINDIPIRPYCIPT